MRRRLYSDEGGWALVTAMLLMTVMMGVGLASVSFVDGQQRQAGQERVRESAFNLADATLSAQAFAITHAWPAQPSSAMVPCTATLPAAQGTADARCPDLTKVRSAFSSADYTAGATVSTLVRDNGPDLSNPTFYDDATAAAQPSYDQNGDKRLWVRAQATVGARTRTLVALVRVDEQPVPFPDRALIAGSIATSNLGNKTLIVTRDSTTGAYAPISVRCDPAAAGCVEFDRAKGQIAPDTVESQPFPLQSAVPESAYAQLREMARANGTLHSSCPSSIAGAVVFIDGPANCSYGASTAYNTKAQPGIVVVNNGTLTLGGGSTFYGVLYARNAQGSSGNVITLQGTTQVVGGILIDGAGGLLAGSSKINLIYDPTAGRNARLIGDGTIVRNTWRELPTT